MFLLLLCHIGRSTTDPMRREAAPLVTGRPVTPPTSVTMTLPSPISGSAASTVTRSLFRGGGNHHHQSSSSSSVVRVPSANVHHMDRQRPRSSASRGGGEGPPSILLKHASPRRRSGSPRSPSEPRADDLGDAIGGFPFFYSSSGSGPVPSVAGEGRRAVATNTGSSSSALPSTRGLQREAVSIRQIVDSAASRDSRDPRGGLPMGYGMGAEGDDTVSPCSSSTAASDDDECHAPGSTATAMLLATSSLPEYYHGTKRAGGGAAGGGGGGRLNRHDDDDFHAMPAVHDDDDDGGVRAAGVRRGSSRSSAGRTGGMDPSHAGSSSTSYDREGRLQQRPPPTTRRTFLGDAGSAVRGIEQARGRQDGDGDDDEDDTAYTDLLLQREHDLLRRRMDELRNENAALKHVLATKDHLVAKLETDVEDWQSRYYRAEAQCRVERKRLGATTHPAPPSSGGRAEPAGRPTTTTQHRLRDDGEEGDLLIQGPLGAAASAPMPPIDAAAPGNEGRLSAGKDTTSTSSALPRNGMPPSRVLNPEVSGRSHPPPPPAPLAAATSKHTHLMSPSIGGGGPSSPGIDEVHPSRRVGRGGATIDEAAGTMVSPSTPGGEANEASAANDEIAALRRHVQRLEQQHTAGDTRWPPQQQPHHYATAGSRRKNGGDAAPMEDDDAASPPLPDDLVDSPRPRDSRSDVTAARREKADHENGLRWTPPNAAGSGGVVVAASGPQLEQLIALLADEVSLTRQLVQRTSESDAGWRDELREQTRETAALARAVTKAMPGALLGGQEWTPRTRAAGDAAGVAPQQPPPVQPLRAAVDAPLSALPRTPGRADDSMAGPISTGGRFALPGGATPISRSTRGGPPAISPPAAAMSAAARFVGGDASTRPRGDSRIEPVVQARRTSPSSVHVMQRADERRANSDPRTENRSSSENNGSSSPRSRAAAGGGNGALRVAVRPPPLALSGGTAAPFAAAASGTAGEAAFGVLPSTAPLSVLTRINQSARLSSSTPIGGQVAAKPPADGQVGGTIKIRIKNR